MSRATANLYLDERQAMGVEFAGARPEYPDLTPEEKRVCNVIAKGLFLSMSSIQWAYWHKQYGTISAQKDAFNGILKILHGGPLKPLMRA